VKKFTIKVTFGLLLCFAATLAQPWVLSAIPVSPDEMVEQGKHELLVNMDPWTALVYFNQALGLDPNHQQANFWYALTISSGNNLVLDTMRGLQVLDVDNNWLIFDEEQELKYDPLTVIKSVIIDDLDDDYSDESGWQDMIEDVDTADVYGATARYHEAGTGNNQAVWTIDVNTPGYYNLYVWIPKDHGNTSYAKYTVHHADSPVPYTVGVNQGYGPDKWHFLGHFNFDSTGTNRVVLTDESFEGRRVVADAIKLEFAGRISDDQNTQEFSTTGLWEVAGTWGDPPFGFGGGYHKTNQEGATCTWTPDIRQTGKYRIYAYWTQQAHSADDIIYEIQPTGRDAIEVTVNQGDYSKDWVCLGEYELYQGQFNTVKVIVGPGGDTVVADAMLFVPVRVMPTVTEIQAILESVFSQPNGEIELALQSLAKIDMSFQDTVLISQVPGEGISFDLYYGEVKLLEAFLLALKSLSFTVNAYDGDNAVTEIFMGIPGVEIYLDNYLEEFADLGKLRDDVNAGDLLSTAKGALIGSVEAYNEASDYIRDIRPDNDEMNHLIVLYEQYDPDEDYDEWLEDKDDALADEALFRDNLESIYNNLTDPVTYPYAAIVLPDDEEGLDTEMPLELNINVDEFFSNPKDIRSMAESTLDEKDLITDNFDATFDGILPGLTPADLNYIFENGPEFTKTPRIIWENGVPSVGLEWEKVLDENRDAFIRYEIHRALNSDMTLGHEVVGDISNADEVEFLDDSVSGDEDEYYYRLHTFYDLGAGKTAQTYSDAEKAILKIYLDAAYAGDKPRGTREHPYVDIVDAVNNKPNVGSKLCVAEGEYNLSITPLYPRSGMIFEGGYEAVSWTRDVDNYETVIKRNGQRHVFSLYRVRDIVIDGFTLDGEIHDHDPQTAGIHIYSCKSVMINECNIKNFFDGIIVNDNSTVSINKCNIVLNVNRGIDVSNFGYGRALGYGGNTLITGDDAYNPEDFGYVKLFEDDDPGGFSGGYRYYIMVTKSGMPVYVDSLWDDSDNYYSILDSDNTADPENAFGPIDGKVAIVGDQTEAGYIVIEVTTGAELIKGRINNIGIGVVNIEDCLIEDNREGIYLTSSDAVIRNNLIIDNNRHVSSRSEGVYLSGSSLHGYGYDIVMQNNTIYRNNRGIAVMNIHGDGDHVLISDNIVVENNAGAVGYRTGIISGPGAQTASHITLVKNNVYNHFDGNYASIDIGDTDISVDPMFTDGPLGKCCLSQTDSWQSENSPCLDAGSDTADNLGFDSVYTTRTDGQADTGLVDMGYHYPSVINSISAVVINEVYPDDVGYDQNEWVELYNRSDEDVNIGGCWIDDLFGNGSGNGRNAVMIPYGTTVPAKGYYVFDAVNNYFNNDGDDVYLLWPNRKTIINHYDYPITLQGRSFYRYPDGGVWEIFPDSTPTKGTRNDGRDPYIAYLSQSVGSPGTEITIHGVNFGVITHDAHYNPYADPNGDGRVDFYDYLLFKYNVGTTAGATRATCDTDGDGDVDTQDLNNMGNAFNSLRGDSYIVFPNGLVAKIMKNLSSGDPRWFNTSMTCEVPYGAVSGDVYVIIHGVQSNSVPFEIASAPDAPAGLTAAVVSVTEVRLNWQDNSDDETEFIIERSLSPDDGFSQVNTTGPNVTTFQDDGLSAGMTYYYRVRASKHGYMSAYSNTASAVLIGGSISGVVYVEGTSDPLEGVKVYAVEMLSPYGHTALMDNDTTNVDGEFTLTGLNENTHYIYCRKEDYGNDFKFDIQVSLGQTVTGQDLYMPVNPAVIKGKVSLGDDPVGGVYMEVLVNRNNRLYFIGHNGTTDTDPVSNYTIGGINPKTSYSVLMTSKQIGDAFYPHQVRDNVVVQPGAEKTVNFSLVEAARVYGTVSNGIEGLENVDVDISREGWGEHVTTDGAGFYEFLILPGHEYDIIFDPPASTDYVVAKATFTAEAEGAEYERNIVLETGAISISGRVTAEASGEPLSNIQVGYWHVDKRLWRSILTDSNGEYLLSNLPKGEAELRAEPEMDYAAQGVREYFQENSVRDFPLKGESIFKGRIEDEQSGVPQAHITLSYYNDERSVGKRSSSDLGGLFEFRAIPEGIAEIELYPELDTMYPGKSVYRYVPEASIVDDVIGLSQGVRLTGRVLDQELNPVPNIEMRSESKGGQYKNEAMTDADGYFQMNLSIDEHLIMTELESGPYLSIPQKVYVDPETPVSQDVVISAISRQDAETITGDVLNPGSHPIHYGLDERTQIGVMALPEGVFTNFEVDDFYLTMPESMTGVAAFGDSYTAQVYPGRSYDMALMLIYSRKGDQVQSMTLVDRIAAVASGSTGQDLILDEEGATITGEVLKSGQPVLMAVAVLLDQDGNFLAWANTDETGTYYMYNIPPGRDYGVSILHPDFGKSPKHEISTVNDGDLVTVEDIYYEREIIVDNQDPECTYTSDWYASTFAPGYFGNDYIYTLPGSHGSGSGMLMWKPNLLHDGKYEIFARWTAGANRTSTARYVIKTYFGDETVIVDQKIHGGEWVSLGEYDMLMGNESLILLLKDPDGVVVADAVKLEYKAEMTTYIIDNLDYDFSTLGTWGESHSAQGFHDWNYAFAMQGDGSRVATWDINVSKDGSYEVFAKWTSHSSRASNAPYTINAYGSNEVVEVNQRENGGEWVSLGEHDFLRGGDHSVKLSNYANGIVIADAVKLVYRGELRTLIIDNADPMFTAVGSWWSSTSSKGYYNVDYRYALAGKGGKTVKWTPDIPLSGRYEVFTRYTSWRNRASDAEYNVKLNDGSVKTVNVNQRENGTKWVSLGQYEFVDGQSQCVELSDDADGVVIADAVKFVRLN